MNAITEGENTILFENADVDEEVPPAAPARQKNKIIAFPKPLVPEPQYELPELHLPEQPRILDVAEEFQTHSATPLLDGLTFPSREVNRQAASADHIELPLKPVGVAQRLYGAAADTALVLVAAALFGAVSWKLLPKLVVGKPLLLTAAAVPMLLWAIYQYLFLMYGGQTVGMRLAKMRLRSFKGATAQWRQRRRRVFALYFSAASLMMGLLWALVDVDTLCWHDRISGTYMTE